MIECMKKRRTIRQYTEQDVPEELLCELLEVASRASNTGNMQLYSVVVTRDPERKAQLAPAHFNQPMVTSAPVVLTFCADATGLSNGQNGGRQRRALTTCKCSWLLPSMRCFLLKLLPKLPKRKVLDFAT